MCVCGCVCECECVCAVPCRAACRHMSAMPRTVLLCTVAIELYPEQVEALASYQKQYELPNLDKTLRALLQFAADDGDANVIFGKVRCTQC